LSGIRNKISILNGNQQHMIDNSTKSSEKYLNICGRQAAGQGGMDVPDVYSLVPSPEDDEFPVSSEERRAMGSDDLNRRIIAKLQEDGRMPFSNIAKDLGTSEGTVRNRVHQMIEARVLRIIGVADPVALGNDGYAMVALTVAAGADPRDVSKRFIDSDNVTYVLFAAGRYDLLVEVICADHLDLRRFLLEYCYGRADIASVEPILALAMYKSLPKWGRP
jgi:Lrp/AsnC family transcriptional regulator for asnA, asnC and gidA